MLELGSAARANQKPQARVCLCYPGVSRLFAAPVLYFQRLRPGNNI